MNTKITTKVEVYLTEADIINAIIHYVKSIPNHATELDECQINVLFHTEISSPDTFGEITATVIANKIDK